MAQMVVPGMGLTKRVVKKFSIIAFSVYGPPKFGKSVIFYPKTPYKSYILGSKFIISSDKVPQEVPNDT